jgi:hypothetical protein
MIKIWKLQITTYVEKPYTFLNCTERSIWNGNLLFIKNTFGPENIKSSREYKTNIKLSAINEINLPEKWNKKQALR